MPIQGEISMLPIVFQTIMVVLMLIFLYVAMQQKMNDVYKWLVFAGLAALVQNVGYLTMLLSKEEEAAKAALTVEYCGIAYVTSFSMFFVICFFEKNIKNCVKWIIVLENTIVLLSVVFMQYTGLFYKEMYVNVVNGTVKITSLKGPLFQIHLVVNMVEILICLVIPIMYLRKAKTKLHKLKGWLAIVATAFPGAAYLALLLGIAKGFDVVPCSVVFAAFVFFVANLKTGIFDGQNAAYYGIVENLKDPVITVDKNMYYVSSNQSAKELLPEVASFRTGDSVIGKEIFSEEQKQLLWQGEPYELRINGRFFSITVNQVNDNGHLLGYTIFLKDLTNERRQMEEMAALKEQAELANKAKSDFLSNMSHEIRTPINAIMGMNEMILRVTEEEETKKCASNIHNASTALLSLVNNILDLSKIEAGKIEIVEDDYELGKLMKQSYDLVLQKALDKDLYFKVEIANTLPKMLYGDAFHLNQVVVNILTNAIKYTPTGGVTLSVTGTKHAKEKQEILCIKVKDTGIGIKEEDIDNLFNAFRRVDLKKNIHIEGTGLGLAISKRLIELLGGTIRVESVYGEGSTFVIELPQKIVDDSPLGNFMEQYVHNQEIHKVHRTKFTVEKAKILVVDDIDMNLLVVKSLLKGTKVQIDTAKSGFESLERTKENKYDLIFMDHMMPGMDGIEAFQQIRQQENGKNKNTPVIILTANALSGMKEKYMEEGFDDYLSKPVTGEALEEMLYRYISKELIVEVGE